METQLFIPPSGDTRLVILEKNTIRVCPLETKESWTLGRVDPTGTVAPDIPLSSMIVSRRHGSFHRTGDQWYYTDNPDNLNGTYRNGRKIPRPLMGESRPVLLTHGDVLRIDNTDLNRANKDGVLMLFTTVPINGVWTKVPLAGRNSIVIGRDPGCDIVEPLPYLSSRHAKITRMGEQYYLSDCGSTAGTFLNGKRVEGSQLLREKDYIAICDCSYFFLGDVLLYTKRNRPRELHTMREIRPALRPVVLKADILTKRVKDNSGSGMKELIRDIHLEIREGTLVALLGSAGAGKSTVMNCLNGMDLEGVEGAVRYRNVDLLQHFDQMKYLIGNVPQQKTFHPAFTPEQEFRNAAIKRLPADTSRKEIEERVNKTLEMLSMTGVRRSRNSKLSGGEQTRVNVGIELVADRDLLCLDEPDQGLSPNYKHELFEILRNLAHKNGKSILTIIHDVSEIDLFDQVIILTKADGVGRLAFSGTPAEARKHFRVEDVRDVYELLERDPKKYIRR